MTAENPLRAALDAHEYRATTNGTCSCGWWAPDYTLPWRDWKDHREAAVRAALAAPVAGEPTTWPIGHSYLLCAAGVQCDCRCFVCTHHNAALEDRPTTDAGTLERLLAEATPRPWKVLDPQYGEGWIDGPRTDTDASLIVAAVNVLPEHLATIAALEAKLAALREAVLSDSSRCAGCNDPDQQVAWGSGPNDAWCYAHELSGSLARPDGAAE